MPIKAADAIANVERQHQRHRTATPSERLVLDAAHDLFNLAAMVVDAAGEGPLPPKMAEVVKVAKRIMLL